MPIALTLESLLFIRFEGCAQLLTQLRTRPAHLEACGKLIILDGAALINVELVKQLIHDGCVAAVETEQRQCRSELLLGHDAVEVAVEHAEDLDDSREAADEGLPQRVDGHHFERCRGAAVIQAGAARDFEFSLKHNLAHRAILQRLVECHIGALAQPGIELDVIDRA